LATWERTKSQRLRRQLVETLSDAGQIRSDAVRDAFLAVPREVFIPGFAAKNRLEDVYKPQEAIPTRFDDHGFSISSSSAPSIMAVMLEQLELGPGHRVLEIGAGTGYNAALLKHIVGPNGRVTSIDIDGRNTREARAHAKIVGSAVRVVTGDGRAGVARAAPYDRIIATVASDVVPRAWFKQLRPDGVIVLPLRLCAATDQPQASVAFRKYGRGLRSVDVTGAGFMGMRDEEGSPATFVRHVDIRVRGGGADDRFIAMLSGASIAEMDATKVRKLLSLALEPERERKLPLDVPEFTSFHTFFALSAPADRLIISGTGLVDRRVRSFAYMRPSAKGVTLRASGGDWAERRIRSALDAWKKRGKPSKENLRIEVAYGKDTVRGWRTTSRGGQHLGFRWARTGS
jgi:protein-L-isoaspartate(D-aspartate) O-methyltransferase